MKVFNIIIPIPGFKNYGITTGGKVWNFRHKRWLKSVKQPHGYSTVDLGYRNKQYIHKLMLETFVGKCPRGMECCHNNGNKSDNRLENLRWDTRASNNVDRLKHGVNLGVKGENHHKAKLTNTDVLLIRELYSYGLSQAIIAEAFEISNSEISLIVNRKIWKHI